MPWSLQSALASHGADIQECVTYDSGTRLSMLNGASAIVSKLAVPSPFTAHSSLILLLAATAFPTPN